MEAAAPKPKLAKQQQPPSLQKQSSFEKEGSHEGTVGHAGESLDHAAAAAAAAAAGELQDNNTSDASLEGLSHVSLLT